jgi:ankyrin repeat protein
MVTDHKSGQSLEAVTKLLEFRPSSSLTSSVDINCVDPNFDTPLTIAVRNGNIDLLTYLIKSKANIEKGDRVCHSPPLLRCFFNSIT